MARSDDDTWDVSSESVGATALGAAEGRAIETKNQHGLISDPYAQLFLDVAAERGISYSQFTDDLHARLREIDPLIYRQLLAQWAYIASRTKWFDDFFATSSADVEQAVILGAGLDTRARRLPWKPGSAVYEIDQPGVLAFKTEALQSGGVEAACRYTAVGIDLRQDWPKALCDAGFDPHKPTAWSAEGLLAYLPADAQDLLFDRIHALSVADSRVGVDVTGAAFFDPENLARLGAWFGRFREAVHQAGGKLPDTPGMWFDENRTDVFDWLREHGWKPMAIAVHDLMGSYHRGVSEEEAVAIPACDFICGQLS